MKLQVVRANNIRFTCYVHGHGPRLLLLLHGFPDDAATMLRLMERLDASRFTLVAPHLRGFRPSSRASDRRYHYADLGRDALALTEALGFEQAMIYGHDLGALAGFAACQLDAARVSHMISASMPPVKTFIRNGLRHPKALARCWHVALLQLPWLGEQVLSWQEVALVERLWRQWSPSWQWEGDRVAKVKSSLARRATRASALRYYRGFALDALLDRHAWKRSAALAKRPLHVPTTLILGEEDGCVSPVMFRRVEKSFGPHVDLSLHRLEGCGHFPHHERLEQVARLIEQAADRAPRASQ